MKIKKGDKVQVLAGKDKGKNGSVVKILPENGKVIVEGVNLRTKHQKKRKEGEKGTKIQFAAPMDAAKLMVICPKCGKPTRVGIVVQEKSKLRKCKKCAASF